MFGNDSKAKFHLRNQANAYKTAFDLQYAAQSMQAPLVSQITYPNPINNRNEDGEVMMSHEELR